MQDDGSQSIKNSELDKAIINSETSMAISEDFRVTQMI